MSRCDSITNKAVKNLCTASTSVGRAVGDFGGASFNYVDFVQSPDVMNIKLGESWDQIGGNMQGLLDYTGLLFEKGPKRASTTTRNFGARYLLNTQTQCEEEKTGNNVERSILIDNYTNSREGGLINSIFNDVSDLNPGSVMGSFFEDAVPKCKKIEIKKLFDSGNGLLGVKKQTGYVANKDYDDITKNNKCAVWGSSNGCDWLSQEVGRELFTNYNRKQNYDNNNIAVIKDENSILNTNNIYVLCISIFGIYVLDKVISKKK